MLVRPLVGGAIAVSPPLVIGDEEIAEIAEAFTAGWTRSRHVVCGLPGARVPRRRRSVERVAAGAAALGGRVVDREPGLLERVDEVDRRLGEVRARSSCRSRGARRTAPRPESFSRPGRRGTSRSAVRSTHRAGRRRAARCRRGLPRRELLHLAGSGLGERDHRSSGVGSWRSPDRTRGQLNPSSDAGIPAADRSRRSPPRRAAERSRRARRGRAGTRESGVPGGRPHLLVTRAVPVEERRGRCAGCPNGGVPPTAKPGGRPRLLGGRAPHRRRARRRRRASPVSTRFDARREREHRRASSAMNTSDFTIWPRRSRSPARRPRRSSCPRGTGATSGSRPEPRAASRNRSIAPLTRAPTSSPARRASRERLERGGASRAIAAPSPDRSTSETTGTPRARSSARPHTIDGAARPRARAPRSTPATTFPRSDCRRATPSPVITRSARGDALGRARRLHHDLDPRAQPGAAEGHAARSPARRPRPRPARRARSTPRSRSTTAARCPSARSSTATSSGSAPFCGP